MSKKMRSLIMLTAASLVACAVIAGGVLFAWMATNKEVTGGIRANILQKIDDAVIIEKFNGGEPDDGYRVFPGDTMTFGLKARVRVSDFYVNLKNDSFTEYAGDWQTYGSFGGYMMSKADWQDKNDLLLGPYREEVILNDGSADGKTIERDFNVESFLAAKGVADAAAEKRNFMRRFIESQQNDLLKTMSVKLTGIGGISFDSTLDPTSAPIGLTASVSNRYIQTFYIVGASVPADHDIVTNAALSTYFTFEDNISDPRKITKLELPADIKFEVKVGFGIEDDGASEPEMVLTDGNKGVFDAGRYYSLNYNCYSFQQMTVALSGTKVE